MSSGNAYSPLPDPADVAAMEYPPTEVMAYEGAYDEVPDEGAHEDATAVDDEYDVFVPLDDDNVDHAADFAQGHEPAHKQEYSWQGQRQEPVKVTKTEATGPEQRVEPPKRKSAMGMWKQPRTELLKAKKQELGQQETRAAGIWQPPKKPLPEAPKPQQRVELLKLLKEEVSLTQQIQRQAPAPAPKRALQPRAAPAPAETNINDGQHGVPSSVVPETFSAPNVQQALSQLELSLVPCEPLDELAQQVVAKMASRMRNTFGPRAWVRPFGAFKQGCHLQNSELQLCLDFRARGMETDEERLKNSMDVALHRGTLEKLAEKVANMRAFEVKQTLVSEDVDRPRIIVEAANLPEVPGVALEAHISVGTTTSHGVEVDFVDRIIRRVLVGSPKALTLIRIVKRWAELEGVHDASEGNLSLLAWTLLCLYFLVSRGDCDPGVFFQQDASEQEDVSKLPAALPRSVEEYDELSVRDMAEFFDMMSGFTVWIGNSEAPWGVSVLTGKSVPRMSDSSAPFYIEDIGVRIAKGNDANAADGLTATCWQHILASCQTASEVLRGSQGENAAVVWLDSLAPAAWKRLEPTEQYQGPAAMSNRAMKRMRITPDNHNQGFVKHGGFITEGGDLLTEKMTVAQAKQKALDMETCKGFTFKGKDSGGPLQICFKDKFDNINITDWTSYSLPERLGLVQEPRKEKAKASKGKGKRQSEDWSQQEPDKGKGKRQREDWPQQEPDKGKGKTQRDSWSQQEPDKGKGKTQRDSWSQQEPDKGKGKRQREDWSQEEPDKGKGKKQRDSWPQQEPDKGKGKRQRESWSQGDNREDAWQIAQRGPASTGAGPRTPPPWTKAKEEPGLTTQAPAKPRSMGTWAARPSRPQPAASRGW